MSRWTCKCGQYMNDHSIPDDNLFWAFSDKEWDTISELTDVVGNINWYSLPGPTYEIYKCPSCGRLMVFANSNQCLFFKPEFDPKDAQKILTESIDIQFHIPEERDAIS